MRIAQVAPPWVTVPPRGYGGIEWIVSFLADESQPGVRVRGGARSRFQQLDLARHGPPGPGPSRPVPIRPDPSALVLVGDGGRAEPGGPGGPHSSPGPDSPDATGVRTGGGPAVV